MSIGIDIVSDMLTNQDMPPSQPIPFQRNGSSAYIILGTLHHALPIL
ncbi:hypothetical protein [uncultured Prevotella sp.]|nr:hypothetical protein [uncultured Prevotella sp.]